MTQTKLEILGQLPNAKAVGFPRRDYYETLALMQDNVDGSESLIASARKAAKEFRESAELIEDFIQSTQVFTNQQREILSKKERLREIYINNSD